MISQGIDYAKECIGYDVGSDEECDDESKSNMYSMNHSGDECKARGDVQHIGEKCDRRGCGNVGCEWTVLRPSASCGYHLLQAAPPVSCCVPVSEWCRGRQKTCSPVAFTSLRLA